MNYEKSEMQLLSEAGLSPKLIEAELQRRGVEAPGLFVFYETDSTNREARDYAKANEGDAIFITDGQTAGRGRRGKKFISAHNAGIYMSILMHPEEKLSDFSAVTTYAAVAVCRAIERQTGLSPEIKWVNDVYVGGRKCCGILTEGVLSADMRSVEYAICGIGVNVKRTAFPDEITDIAISLEEAARKELDRNLLIAEIISEFYKHISEISSDGIRNEYKRRSFLVGREVIVTKLSGSYGARVIGVADDMSLLLRLPDGSTEKLATGEVSVKESFKM